MSKRAIIWSDSIEDFVIKGFTYKGQHYTWNEPNAVYMRDDVDDVWLFSVPELAIDDRI